MTISNKVIWHEGLFLQPHHFQQHDRYIERLVSLKSEVLSKNLWGFKELSLDTELLPLGKINVQTAVGIFPDGTPFDIPHTDNPPQPFEIPTGMSNTTLYLALPLKQLGVAETGNLMDSQLYRNLPVPKTIPNGFANQSDTAEIEVASLACRILTEHDDLSSYTCLPIARVLEARANHQITLDKSFLTTWVDAQQAPPLKKFIEEVHGLLITRANMLAGRLTDANYAGTAEIADFMLLQMINRFEPIFHYLMNKQPLHPETLFVHLISLMGEMSTFTNNKRRPIEPPLYQHVNLYETFRPVIRELRQSLSTVLEQNATQVPLENREHGLWVGMISDKTLIQEYHFILAVYSDVPLEETRTKFANQIKIAPVEKIKTLVSRALPGVRVSPVAQAPRQMPYHANYVYFTIDVASPLWQELINSGGVAMHVTGQTPGLHLELWAIKG